MAFSLGWVESDPDGSVITVSQLDDWIRNTKVAIRERLEGDSAAPDLTGLIEVSSFSTAPKPRKGAARIYVDTAANIAAFGVTKREDGRLAVASDTGVLYHVATAAVAAINIGAANVLAGTFPSGAFVFQGAVSGVTTLTATTLAGALSTAAQPNVTSVGTLSGLTVTAAPTFSAMTATRVLFAGTAGLLSDSAALTYNSGTGALTATTFIGNLTGNVTGNTSGSSGSCTGLAATATALATARAINGVNFDGTAPITVTAAAGTLSGTTLAATVVTSSLTTIGTLVAGAVPASLVTAGTFPAGTFSVPTLAVTSGLTLTGATITGFTGNITGNASGSSGSCTGLAATATALATPRAINGVNFDGTAPITVTADANTLSGTTLKSTVVTSSLTTIGTLVAGAVPASLVTAGTFPSGTWVIGTILTVSGTLNVGGSPGSFLVKTGATTVLQITQSGGQTLFAASASSSNARCQHIFGDGTIGAVEATERVGVGELYAFTEITDPPTSGIGLTGTADEAARSTGVGTIKFNDSSARDSSGFVKIIVNGAARYVPFFSAI